MAGHILLVEDDKALSALMQDFFRAAGVRVTPTYDGEQALTLAQERSFDLLVLDVMMPQLNGLEVCQAVRRESDVPVIFVTALGQEGDTLAGFRAGADDYITKPFSFPVLVAKAQALMRRARGLRLGETELGYGSILLDTATYEVTVDGLPVSLRPKEAQILELLLREQGRTVSRDLLIERVWGVDFDGDERMVDRHVASLRKALGTAAQHIKAVYGKGYRLGGIVMKKLKTLWGKRSIAARLTALFAVFLVLGGLFWLWSMCRLAAQYHTENQFYLTDSANDYTAGKVREVLGYAPQALPSPDTDAYWQLRSALPHSTGDKLTALTYFAPASSEAIYCPPRILLDATTADGPAIDVDIGLFSTEDIIAICRNLTEPGNALAELTAYGMQSGRDFFPN